MGSGLLAMARRPGPSIREAGRFQALIPDFTFL
jgi:hypothetical protein